MSHASESLKDIIVAVRKSDVFMQTFIEIRSVLFPLCWTVRAKKKAGESGSAAAALCCAPGSGSAIHHQVERLFTAGVKVPDTCLRALSDEPLLVKAPVHAAEKGHIEDHI